MINSAHEKRIALYENLEIQISELETTWKDTMLKEMKSAELKRHRAILGHISNFIDWTKETVIEDMREEERDGMSGDSSQMDEDGV